MTLSIGDALKLSPLAHGQLIAGAEGIARNLCDVHVRNQLAQNHLINYGELVVLPSTSIQDPIELASCVQVLDEQHAAALVIADKGIPRQLIEQCDALQLPLIQISDEAPLHDLEQQLLHTIHSHKEKSALIDKQRQLMRFALQDEQPAALFDNIAYILNYPIAIISCSKQLLFNNSGLKPQKLLEHVPDKAAADMYIKTENSICCLSIMSHHECIGYLLIVLKREYCYAQEELLFIQAAEVLAAHLGRFMNAELSPDSYRWSLALQLYLQHKISDEAFVQAAAAYWGKHRAAQSYTCLIASVKPRDSQLQLQRLGQQLNLLGSTYGFACFHLIDEQQLITIMLQQDEHANPQAVEAELEKLLAGDSHPRLQIAISKPKTQLQQLLAAYEECLHALEMCEQLKITKQLIRFADLEFNYILQQIPPAIRAQFSSSLLRPLLEKDEQYKAEILKTLDAYLEHEASVSETAKALFVHRNTVLYRIDKVSELLGLDFKKMSHLMQLKLALVFYKLAASPQ